MKLRVAKECQERMRCIRNCANLFNGFFFGMGECPMIARTLVDLSAGYGARLSGIIASLTILVIILAGAPVTERLPVAHLTGVMIMVVAGTFEYYGRSCL